MHRLLQYRFMNLNKGIFFIASSLLLLVCSCGNEDNYLLTDNSDNNKLTTGNSFLSYYVSVGAESYYPVDTTNTEYTIFVPFGTDVTTLKPVFLDNSKTVMTNELEQISGESIVDFSNYKTGVEYILTSEDGEEKNIQ